MVRIRDVAWVLAVAAVALAVPRPALADQITFTGNVANDFTTSNGSTMIAVDQGPNIIAGPTGDTPGQLPSGVFIQNIWLNYNSSTDTMNVGIQGYTKNGQQEIFGDASGTPNPTANQFPNLASVAIAFAPVMQNAAGQNAPGNPTIIAGIPQIKTSTDPSAMANFSVSQYSANPGGLAFSFGNALPGAGSLAFNPSAAQPDLEFTINNFSKISGVNLGKGLYMEAYSGITASTEGKVQTSWLFIPQPQSLPEPTTWVVWAALAGGAALRFRRTWRSRP
jgi:hypothetical protein